MAILKSFLNKLLRIFSVSPLSVQFYRSHTGETVSSSAPFAV